MKILAATRLLAAHSAGVQCNDHLFKTQNLMRKLKWHANGSGATSGIAHLDADQYDYVIKTLKQAGYKPLKKPFKGRRGTPFTDGVRFDNGRTDFVGYFFVEPPENDSPGVVYDAALQINKKV